MAEIRPERLPFRQAIDFFRNKINLPSSSWADIWQQQHGLAFTVAGAQSDALLADFRGALTRAMEAGTGYAQFQQDFVQITERHKWAYQGKPGWRSRVMYDTNITQAYQAGRWQQMWPLRDLRPFLQYVHTSVDHPRLEHQAWDGLILPMTDTFWDTHTPQNGWGCKCQVHSLTAEEAQAAGGVDRVPELEWQEVVVNPQGSQPRVVRTPKGVQAGFGYNPGKAYLQPHTVPPVAGYAQVVQERMASGQMFPGTLVPDKAAAVLSAARHRADDLLLPADTSADAAVGQFLQVFGLEPEQAAVLSDGTRARLVVGRDLFLAEDKLDWMPVELRRAILLQAYTILDPDEVWWAWERADADQWVLRRHYVKAFSGQSGASVSRFSWARDGWVGHSVLQASEADLEVLRVGRLVFKASRDGQR